MLSVHLNVRSCDMASKRAFAQSSILALLLSFLVLAPGCAPPKFQPEQFVATWTRTPEGSAYPFNLQLLPDGTGVTSGPYDPHPITIKWHLRRDKLVIAPQDGRKPIQYDVRFDGPDEIVLITGDSEFSATRVKTE